MGWEKKESTILPFKVQSGRFLNRNLKGKGDEKSPEKVGIQDRPSKVYFCDVLGQLGKTIDRISSRSMKRVHF